MSAGLAINKSRVRIPAAALPSATLDKLFSHQEVKFGTGQWAVMLGGWGLTESNGSLQAGGLTAEDRDQLVSGQVVSINKYFRP